MMRFSLAPRLGLLALALALPGCGVARAQDGTPQGTAAQRASAQGTAVVDVAALMRVHPFAPVLAQYDREIAALRSTALTAGSIETEAALRAGESGFAHERSENALVQGRLNAHAADYRKRENDQLAALDAAPVAPAGVRSALSATYQVQATDVRNRAASSFAQYQSALGHQRGDALGALRVSLDNSLRRSYGAYAQRLAERESDDNVAFVAKNAAERLNLRLRLRNTYTGTKREAIVARLAALDKEQQNAMTRQRAIDNRALAQQRATLQARYNAEFQRLAAEIDRKIAANATERRAVFTAEANPPQLSGLNEATQPDVDIKAEARDFHANAPPIGKDDIMQTLQAADAEVKANITRLETADRDSRSRTNVEIDTLTRDRATLAQAMRAQILRLAKQDAAGRNVVDAASVTRARINTDVTPAVRAQMKTWSP